MHKALNRLSDERKKLLDSLQKNFPKCEEDFFVGILVYAKHPEDTQHMINFLKEERTRTDVVCESLYLHNKRWHPENNLVEYE